MRSAIVAVFAMLLLCVAGVAAAAAGGGAAATDNSRVPSLIPLPASIDMRAGSVTIRDGMRIVAAPGDRDAMATARYLADLVRRTRGLVLPVVTTAHGVAIRIVIELGTGEAEGYTLSTGPDGVRIGASTKAGLLYGSVSLWQLLTQDGARRLRGGLAKSFARSIRRTPAVRAGAGTVINAAPIAVANPNALRMIASLRPGVL